MHLTTLFREDFPTADYFDENNYTNFTNQSIYFNLTTAYVSTDPRKPGNPLLYVLHDVTVQPYVVIFAQLLVLQIVKRLYYRYFCCCNSARGGWLSSLEQMYIAREQQERFSRHDKKQLELFEVHTISANVCATDTDDSSNSSVNTQTTDNGSTEKRRKEQWHEGLAKEYENRTSEQQQQQETEELPKMEYDLVDIIFALVGNIHFIWIVVEQTKCMSVAGASRWRCYNILGYRLYNFMLTGIWPFLIALDFRHRSKIGCWQKSMTRIGKLCEMTQQTILLLMIVFLFTNVIPMIVVFIWVFFIVNGGFIIILIFIFALLHYRMRYLPDIDSCFVFIWTPAYIFVIILLPITVSTFYNYSQYYYFGDEYIQTIIDEYNARTFSRWIVKFMKTIELPFHTVLGFF
ncbi:unnamed protein product [Rotaria magnacalcarata]|uniref:Uncharacterized protein n=1 Tax=Rotaria magnacalcarata TaxID=392030 RepID=A0A816YLL9_9BILA|nr:unnamed protein product [Rotaria magnacalcarata]CAF1673257.1 unnamed protein product [Rotaria magnacalcarata]CAF2162029.1 unnamed protein product [Rotaria magnacalcarata]CAF3751234.1 unnamed protein product [Rotaria magnacalcarata]CAF3787524.1 unnamed protein product [Rotaria magnacalcarata]